MGAEHDAALDPSDAAQRRALLRILLLNGGLAVVLLVGGLAADSSGLIANALDNASDAIAYSLSFFAVTRSQRWRAHAATITGLMLIALAVGVVGDATRRFVTGSEPLGPAMMVLAVIAAVVNAWCIKLLYGHRGEDVNLRAAWTMSINDFVANFGVLIAGTLVATLGSSWPDLAVAAAIAAVAGYGAIKTLRDAARSRNAADPHSEHPHG